MVDTSQQSGEAIFNLVEGATTRETPVFDLNEKSDF